MFRSVKSFDNTKISYDIHGKAKKNILFFVHGAGGDYKGWSKERKFFHNNDYSTIAMDLRGHGLSQRPQLSRDYKLDNFARDIKAIVRKERLITPIFIGHCFGGMVLIQYQKLFPNKARSYVFVDTSYKAPQQLKIIKHHPFFLHLLNTIFEHEHLKGHYKHVKAAKFVGTQDMDLRRIFSDITHTRFKSFLFTYETMSGFDGVKALQSIRVPTLVVEGKNDSFFPPKIAKKISSLVRTSHLKIIPKANHIIVINNPKKLEQAIQEFLNNI